MAQDVDDRVSRICLDLRQEPPFPGRNEPTRSLAERMTYYATPGVSVAVIDNFEVVWARGFGKRMTGAPDAVTQSTPFQAGSISKPVFALAVMKLVEMGKLDLDADINDYLASWRVPSNDGWNPRLTLRQLLSHTAGTTVHGFVGYPSTVPWPTVSQILLGLSPANNSPIIVDRLPGAQFRYSGGGTTIAQQVVVDALRKPFPELMRELVLDPVGMSDSSFEQPLPSDVTAKVAMAHPWNGVQTPGGYHIYPEMAAAGLWTTAADLASLGAEMMRALRGYLSKLGLSQETVAGMLRPQLEGQRIGQDFAGLGWFCAGANKEFRFRHGGANEGFLAEIQMFPALGKGAVVMINSNQGWFLLSELINAIGREYQWPNSQTIPAAVPKTSGNAYAGLYRSEGGATVLISQETERLLFQFGQQDRLPLFKTIGEEFFAKAINLTLRFNGPDAAKPVSLTLVQGGESTSFNRVDG